MIQSLLADLRDLLTRQVGDLEALEDILRRQKECLVTRDVSGLIEAVKRQEEQLCRVQSMEEERLRLMGEIAPSLGLDPSEASLNRVADNLEAGVGKELHGLGQAVGETLRRISTVNGQNRKLIEHSLDIVQGTLGRLTRREDDRPTYNSAGRMHVDGPRRALVDHMT